MTICECCDRVVGKLPYHHDNHNPPYDGYDYCQACYDWGCGGPSDCHYSTPDLKEPSESDMDYVRKSLGLP